jgi:uncharacterized membrane protein (UPF0182 family)
LLDQRGSRVIYGDLQIVNIGKGLVYVRPLFVRPDDPSAKQIFVRKFLASYNNKVVLADDLTSAIAKLFPGFKDNLGDRINDGSATPAEDTATSSAPTDDAATTDTTLPSSTGGNAALDTPNALLAKAEELFAEADAALGNTPPDFSLYQQKLAEARSLISQAISLIGG